MLKFSSVYMNDYSAILQIYWHSSQFFRCIDILVLLELTLVSALRYDFIFYNIIII